MAPLAVAAIAVSMAYLQSVGNQVPEINPPAATTVMAAKSAQSVGLPPVEDQAVQIETVQARPLLAQGRRVPDPIALEPEPNADPEVTKQEIIEPSSPVEMESPRPSNLHMVGVMTEGGNVRVLIRNDDDQSENWFVRGDSLGGWTLVEITQDTILLQAGGNEATIMMFE